MHKVILIGPVYPFRGGIAHHTTLLAEALQKKHTTQVISFLRQYPKWLYPGTSDRDPSQQPMQIEARYLLDPINPISWIKTYRAISKFQPDYVVIPWWTTFWAPADLFLSILLRIKRIPLFYLIHNVLPHEAHRVDPLLARLCFRFASGFLVQSRNEQEKLQQLVRTDRIGFYPHPVYQPFDAESISQAEARQKLEIPIDRFTLLFFGIVRPYKGLAILLEALNELKLKHEFQPLLLVAGEIWGDPKVYFEMVDRFELNEQVRFYNRYIKNEELPVFFHAADLFVAPYLEGTQSGALNMARGFQLPIVATEVIVDQKPLDTTSPHLVCVPTGDVVSLANVIANFLENPKKLAFQQQPTEEIELDWDRMVSAIESIAIRLTREPT